MVRRAGGSNEPAFPFPSVFSQRWQIFGREWGFSVTKIGDPVAYLEIKAGGGVMWSGVMGSGVMREMIPFMGGNGGRCSDKKMQQEQEVWERREASALTIKIRSLTLFKRAGRCGYCAPEARASHRFASA